MKGRGLARFAPLAGVVWFIAVVVALFSGNESPDTDASTREVVEYWTKHDSAEITFTIVGAIASIFLVWFAGSLRSALWRSEGGSGRLSALSFGGAVILATGFVTTLGFEFAAADSAGDVPAQVTQTLSVLNSDFFFPMVIGNFVFLFAAGLAIVRFRGLPAWLGWVALVIGVLSITPVGYIGLGLGVIWVLIASILLFLRGDAPAAPPPPPAPA
jgi:hypothetical protein